MNANDLGIVLVILEYYGLSDGPVKLLCMTTDIHSYIYVYQMVAEHMLIIYRSLYMCSCKYIFQHREHFISTLSVVASVI